MRFWLGDFTKFKVVLLAGEQASPAIVIMENDQWACIRHSAQSFKSYRHVMTIDH